MMHHYSSLYTVACVVRAAPWRLPSSPCRRIHKPASLCTSVRCYTAIPLSTLFVHRGSGPHLAGRANGASPQHSAATAPSSDLLSASTCRSATASPTRQEQNRHCLPLCGLSATSTSCAGHAASALVERLRVSESMRPAARIACVRVPRLLVFGGDVVSLTALEALHARMRCIVTEALRCARRSTTCSSTTTVQDGGAEERAEVEAFVREHITVVCPALPKGTTPEEAARKFTRQYPVARYCIDHGLPVIPVDHPKSLARSTLLKEMLSTVQGATDARTSAETSQTVAAACSARPQRSAAVAGRLPSHVLPAAALMRGRGRDVPPHTSCAGGGKGRAATTSGKSEARDAAASAHTWAVQGRPLDEYDLAVVVSFRYLLPHHLLRVLPPVINMHPSLLPRYRGASPIFSTLRHNESVGGVSIIQMRAGQPMDSGSILWQCEVPMTPDMDIRLYFPLVTQIGAAGLCDLIFGEAPPAAAAATPVTATKNVVAAAAFASSTVQLAAAAQLQPPPHPMPHSNASWRHNTEGETRLDTDVSGRRESPVVVPSWVALRRSNLMPLVHRSDGSGPLFSSSLRSRYHLSPYADRPELSLFSSIITAHAADVDGQRGDSEGTPVAMDAGGSAAHRDDEEACTQAGAPPPSSCRHWTTLCRSSTHITPEAVHAASTAHRALFFQSVDHAAAASGVNGHRRKHGGNPVNKKQVSPAAAAEMEISTTMKCAEVFPTSVLSPHCDWPDSFSYSWKFAQVQEYRTFKHFTEDPFHAPLLPKDAAVLRFSAFTAREAFGVWRAFVGGDYFQPSVNATLDKGGSPVRNQLVHRTVRRLLRERAKALRKTKLPLQQPQHHHHRDGAMSTTVVAASAQDETPVGIVVGKHVDLDVFNPAGLALLCEAENTLRIPCTFTHVVNPALAPLCVQAELAEVERGGERGGGVGEVCAGRTSTVSSSCVPGRHVRFYRAPPAIFRCLLSTGASLAQAATASQEQQRRRGGEAEASAAGASRAVPLARTHTSQPEEPIEDDEAPEDYVPEVIHAAPPTEQRWHIPPGTAYFPESDESYGAIKCAEGWLLWKEAHMKWSNKAQPAVLIRKGLAMKTGVLYGGLFSEYS